MVEERPMRPTLIQLQDYRFIRHDGVTSVQLCNGVRYSVSDEMSDLYGAEVIALYKDVNGAYFVKAESGPRAGRRWDVPGDVVFCCVEFMDGVGPVLRVVSVSNSISFIYLK